MSLGLNFNHPCQGTWIYTQDISYVQRCWFKLSSAVLQATELEFEVPVHLYLHNHKSNFLLSVWKKIAFSTPDCKLASLRYCPDINCRACRRPVPMKTGNITNLFYHLKQCHPLEHTKCKRLQKQTLASWPWIRAAKHPEQHSRNKL